MRPRRRSGDCWKKSRALRALAKVGGQGNGPRLSATVFRPFFEGSYRHQSYRAVWAIAQARSI